eukprot:gene12809-3747_t
MGTLRFVHIARKVVRRVKRNDAGIAKSLQQLKQILKMKGKSMSVKDRKALEAAIKSHEKEMDNKEAANKRMALIEKEVQETRKEGLTEATALQQMSDKEHKDFAEATAEEELLKTQLAELEEPIAELEAKSSTEGLTAEEKTELENLKEKRDEVLAKLEEKSEKKKRLRAQSRAMLEKGAWIFENDEWEKEKKHAEKIIEETEHLDEETDESHLVTEMVVEKREGDEEQEVEEVHDDGPNIDFNENADKNVKDAEEGSDSDEEPASPKDKLFESVSNRINQEDGEMRQVRRDGDEPFSMTMDEDTASWFEVGLEMVCSKHFTRQETRRLSKDTATTA